MAVRVLACILLAFTPLAAANDASPIGKIVQMLGDLHSKVVAEGAEAQRVYAEAAEFCEDRSRALGFEIKTSKATVAELTADIADETATSAALTAKVEELVDDISTNEADLKAATGIRATEAADFGAEKQELSEVIDMITRAAGIIEREASKGSASMLQMKTAGTVAEALKVMVSASVFSSADATRLTALVQSSQSDEGEDMGAPAGTVYSSHSGGILETLSSLKDKAEAQLDEAQSKETAALGNFAMLKQSLTDAVKFGNKDKSKAQKNIAASGEAKSKAEGDLSVTSKDLDSATQSLSDLHRDCMTKAQDFEAETNGRNDELKALTTAKNVIEEMTGGAASQSYGLFQVGSSQQLTNSQSLAQFEAVRFVRDLARKEGSKALAQLSSRMAATMHGKGDVFGKIKGLISDMIEKLENESGADADKKAYCDKELAESQVKNEDKTADIEKLTTNIDSMQSRSATLKEETAALQKALADLAGAQGEMDKVREEEHKLFVNNKAEMDQGLEGIKMALKVLRDYYSKGDQAQGAATGSASGVIGLIEVAESDFTRDLAEMTATENTAQLSYDAESKDNEIEKTTKNQDVKYKSKESTDLDKAVGEATSDRAGVQEELDAVNGYLKRLHGQCDEKVESFADRHRRREEEIAGLKEALTILENETALLQTKSRMRGARRHIA